MEKTYWFITTARKNTAGVTGFSSIVIDEHPVDWFRKYRSSLTTLLTEVFLINALQITAEQYQAFEESE
jgi:hypothetical protein